MMVVVRAELWAVQRTVEKMRTKPKTQERRNWEVNRGSDQPPNSGIENIATISPNCKVDNFSPETLSRSPVCHANTRAL